MLTARLLDRGTYARLVRQRSLDESGAATVTLKTSPVIGLLPNRDV